jgi:zinc/manganese transport system substrate-binding protein
MFMSKLLSYALIAVTVMVAAARTVDAKVNVVASVPDLAALVAEVGGKYVNVTSMSLASQDPHFVDAKPSLIVKLNQADLLVEVGLELEIGWLPKLQTAARNSAILSSGAGFLDCSTAIHVLDVPTGAVNRSMGDIHPSGNPHYLYDPRAAAACAQAIGNKLAAIDSGNSKAYLANSKRFVAKLDKARADWEQRMSKFRGTPVVTYHKSWPYLLDWLGLVEVATLEPKPGIPPSPSHVADVLKLARASSVKLIVQESYYPDKIGALCATKLGGSAVVVSAGTNVAKGERYIEHMEHMIAALEQALQ